MTSRDFCYWLQGYFELSDRGELTPTQTDIVKQHLAMVFIHEIDPSAGDAKKQEALNAAHDKPQMPFHPVGIDDDRFRC